MQIKMQVKSGGKFNLLKCAEFKALDFRESTPVIFYKRRLHVHPFSWPDSLAAS